MSKILFVTAFNEGYYDIAFNYINDISKHSRVDNHVVTLDYDQELTLPNLKYHRLNSADLKLPLNNYSVQHGEFLAAIPGKDTDVILFTDADIRMQREFLKEELQLLRSLGEDDVLVGYNAGPSDTLLKEAARLTPLVSLNDLVKRFGKLSSPCFNVGVMACRRSVWEDICENYVRMYPTVQKLFGHVASQQWLISYLASNLYNVIDLDYSFHLHSHYGIPEGGYFVGTPECNILMFRDTPVLLRHKC